MKKPIAAWEFIVGAILVSAQTIFSFWRYSPASLLLFVIAVGASVAVAFGCWKKKDWARQGALLIAILSILGDLMEINDQGEKIITIARIALAAAVIIWLSRSRVKTHFRN